MTNFSDHGSSTGLRLMVRFVAGLLVLAGARAQGLRFEEELPSSLASAQVGLLTEYIQWPLASGPSLRSTVFGTYRKESFAASFFFSTNQNPVFEIEHEHLFFVIPDTVRLANRKEEINLPPNSYEINNPACLCLSYHPNPMEFLISARLYTQTEIAQSLRLVDMGNGVYYLTSEATKQQRSDILLTGTVGYSWGRMKLFGGVSGLEMLNWGADTLPSLRPRPLLGIRWPMLGGESTCESNTKELGFLHSVPLKSEWLPEEQRFRLTAVAKAGFDSYRYRSIEFDLLAPFFLNVEFLFGFRKTWNQFDRLSKQEFIRWQSALSDGIGGDPYAAIQHTAFRVGVSVGIGASREEFPLRLIGSKIYQRNIYAAKKEFYAYNPIGTLDLYNAGKRPIVCQISLELSDHLGKYTSESLKIEPDEMKTVPLYLYLTEQHLNEQSSPVEMEIGVVAGERLHALSSVALTMFDVHSWDGNTWGLRYYLTPDEPTIQTNAKRKYVQALVSDTSLTDAQREMRQLNNFLSELGKTLHYVQDPTTSLYVDRVQFPVETMEFQSGDCEDLALYIASHLMAVGVQCAFVDMKPQAHDVDLPSAGPRQLGHIFLLVNTEIPPECVGEIGLNELQFVTRPSAKGKNTVWIPVETTVLDQGFENAFREGVEEYYREVVEHNGMTKGLVHIYDF
jgi:hypothetical protein